MSGQLALGLAASGWLLASLAAIAVRALEDYSRLELEELCRRAKRPALADDVSSHRAAVVESLDGLRALSIAAFWSGAVCHLGLFQAANAPAPWSEWTLLFVGGAAALVAAEVWLPWAVGELYPARIVFFTWPAWKLWSRLWWPLGRVGWAVGKALQSLIGRERSDPPEEKFEEEIREIVTEGQREGLIEDEARGMIEGVMELRDASVSEIMTPRTEMVSMHVATALKEAARLVLEMGHSRVPVYDKNRDDVVGVLYAKDLLEEFAKAADEPQRALSDLVRPAYFVPESKPVHDLLREFRKTRNHMAVVLDEYGGVSGLVTIEDVLEEIVGEIADEYDEVDPEGFREINAQTAEVLGGVRVDEINKRLKIDLSDQSDFETIGGFVFSELGRLPKVGDVVTVRNIRVTVLDVTRRRVERVRIEVLDEAPSEPVS